MRVFALTCACAIFPPLLPAAVFTWDGGGTNNFIFTAANWVGDSVPTVNGTADFVFTGSTRTNPQLNGTFPVNSITFPSGAASFTIDHSTSIGSKRFQIGAGGITQADGSTQTVNTDILLTSTQTWHADAGTLNIGSTGTSRVVDLNGNLLGLLTDPLRTISLHSQITGTGNITKSGLGTATLYNAGNSWVGATTVNEGILRVAADGAFSASSSLNINPTGRFDLNGFDTTALWLGGSGQLDLGGGALTVGDASSRTYSGVIEGTGGGLIKQGVGTLTLDGVQITDGTEYWAKAGTLTVENSLGTSPVLRINPGATIEVNPAASLNASGLWGAGTIDLNQKDLYVTIGTGESYFFNGTLLGGASADLFKLGDGKLTLGDADTYTGDIRVNDGTLGFAGDNIFDASNPLGVMIINSAGRMELDGTEQTFYNLTANGPIDLDGGALRLVGGQAVGDSKIHTVELTGTGDLLFRDTSSYTDPYFPDINLGSQSFLNFSGSIIIEAGVLRSNGLANGIGGSTNQNIIDLRDGGGLWVDVGFDVKTLIGDGTLYTTTTNHELLGDGGSHNFSGRIFPFLDNPGSTSYLTIRNQSWTFDGRIVQNDSDVEALVASDASASFRTAGNGDIAIPDKVRVETGGTVGFVLDGTSSAWELAGPTDGVPGSGTAAINATNSALASVTLEPSFNNILLVSTSNGGRVRLSGGGSALLSGSGEVELGDHLTLMSLTGSMDIDLRGHALYIKPASAKIFTGRFVDSVGGGRVLVEGSGDFELRGMSTFDGALYVGTDGGGNIGKVIAGANEVLSDQSEVLIYNSSSEFDLLDHTLTIRRLTGFGGQLSGATGSNLALGEVDYWGVFSGDLDLQIDEAPGSSFAQRIGSTTGNLRSLTTRTNNFRLLSSQIDVAGDINMEWVDPGDDSPFRIADSTLRSTGSIIRFVGNEEGFGNSSFSWNGTTAFEISSSTLEGQDILFEMTAPISIIGSTLRPTDSINGVVSVLGESVSIESSTLGGSDLPMARLNLGVRDLSITSSSLEAKRGISLLTSDSTVGSAVITGSTLVTDNFTGGNRPSHTVDWQFSSLTSLSSKASGIWTIEASDLDFGTLTANPGAIADFRSGSISVSNDLSLGFGEFLGTDLTLTGLHELNVGGTFTIDRFASLTLDGGDLSVGDMTVDGEFDWIDGDLTVDGFFGLGGSSFLGTDLVLGNQQDLIVNGGMAVDYGSSLTLDGGSLRTTGSGNGFSNNGTLSLLRGPIRTESFSNSGTAFIGSLLTVENDDFNTTAGSNYGTLEMTGPGAILQLQNGGRLNNEGLISGTGVIDGGVVNDNIFTAGRIRADLGESLRITGDLDNAGTVELVGGSVETQGILTNTGGVTGRGLLAGNRSLSTAIDNQGTMTFSGGTSDVYGNVGNTGTVISTGGGVVTFHDGFVNSGTEMRTSAGSGSVFLGDVSGSGAFTGTGTVYFEGAFNPGMSPGLVTATVDLVMGTSLVSTFEIGGYGQGTEYDFLDAEGDLTLDGMLHILLYGGFLPEAGDSFDLFDAPSITGSFDEIHASELPEGLEWDFSQLESDGIVSVQSTVTDPYDAWTAFWSLSGADALREADPNNDGVTNLEHFAFDTNPLTGASDGRTRVELAFDGAERYLTYTIPVRVGALFDAAPSATIDGMVYSLSGDDDLVGSDLTVVERPPLAAGMPPLRDIDGDGFADWEYRSFRLNTAINALPRGFIQASVTSAP